MKCSKKYVLWKLFGTEFSKIPNFWMKVWLVSKICFFLRKSHLYSCLKPYDLKIHISAVHEGKKPYKCTICDNSFGLKRNLKSHIASVHEGKKSFQCNVCGQSFTEKWKMREKSHLNVTFAKQDLAKNVIYEKLLKIWIILAIFCTYLPNHPVFNPSLLR